MALGSQAEPDRLSELREMELESSETKEVRVCRTGSWRREVHREKSRNL